jgi:hypothetical protein
MQPEACSRCRRLSDVADNNAMNQPNRGVPGMKVGRASGEPVLAEVGPPFMLSLDVAGYCSVIGRLAGALEKR